MARKKRHEEHVNNERWLVSYADFITLLFAFFTTMYAISTVDKKKMGKLVDSVSVALHHIGKPKSIMDPSMPNPWQPSGSLQDPLPGGSKRPDRALAELAQAMAKLAESQGGDARFQVRMEPRGVVLSLGEAALFSQGDVRLRQQGLTTLDAITRLLLQNPHPVVVEGHTDERGGVKPSANWKLSTERAVNVLSYMVEQHGYPPTKLAAAGYGQYHPIGDNRTKEGQAQNRRVDLVILRDGQVPSDFQR